MSTLLLVILILLLIGVIPAWPHSTAWGWGPGSLVGVILIVFVILLLMGKL